MGYGQGAEHGLALWGKPDQDLATIAAARRASNEPPRHETIDETDRAVVTDPEPLGQGADRWDPPGGQPFQGEERLVVLRLEPDSTNAAATPLEEAADPVAELGESTILLLTGSTAGNVTHLYRATIYDTRPPPVCMPVSSCALPGPSAPPSNVSRPRLALAGLDNGGDPARKSSRGSCTNGARSGSARPHEGESWPSGTSGSSSRAGAVRADRVAVDVLSVGGAVGRSVLASVSFPPAVP